MSSNRAPHGRPPPGVTIVEHRAAWSAEFDAIASDLRQVLGAAALDVDHIGSTAVPALAAKDVIDVQVTVPAFDGIRDRMLGAGYTMHGDAARQDHLPPGFEARADDWTKLFFMQRPGMRRCNIHVRRAGRPNQRYPLLVRDFLRAERPFADAYGELKQRLARSLADPDDYPDVKDPAADLVYHAAERWAAATGWTPAHRAPPGDRTGARLPTPTLQTARLLLRPFAETDAEALYALQSNARVLRYWDSPPWKDRERARAFLEACRRMEQDGSGARFAIETLQARTFIGWCSMFRWNPVYRSLGIGYCLDEPAWGQGYATEAVRALLQWLFDTLDVHRVEAELDTRNAASARVLEKLGFQREGLRRDDCVVDGEVSDSWIYGLLRPDWTAAADAPR